MEPPVITGRGPTGPGPTGPGPRWTGTRGLLVLTLAGVTLTFLACGERAEERAREAEARRRVAEQKPLPLRLAGAPPNRLLLDRLGHVLATGAHPFRVSPALVSDAEALEGIAAGRLDLVLVTGEPDPSLAPRLAKARRAARVLALGADVIAVVANVTNRSSRIDLDGLARALTGEITSWEEAKGDALPLIVYTPPDGSDLTRGLRDQLLKGAPLGVAVRQVEDVATEVESARRTPGALALVALVRTLAGQTLPEAVKLLPVAAKTTALGIPPTDRAAAARGDYPLRLPVVALVRRGQDPVARRLAAWAARARPLEREAWLGLPALPGSDRERIRRAWSGEGPSGAKRE